MLICQFLTSQKTKSKAISSHRERWLSAASVQLQKHQHSSDSSITDITSPKRPAAALEHNCNCVASRGCCKRERARLKKTPRSACVQYLLSPLHIFRLLQFGPAQHQNRPSDWLRCWEMQSKLMLQRTHRQGRINYRDSLIDFLVPKGRQTRALSKTNSFSIQKCQG